MVKAPRLALSGSAGTGKTALGLRLAERLEVPFIPEGMRSRIEAGLDLRTLSRAALRDLVEELYAEASAAMRAAETSHGGFVADRAPLDFLTFWLYYGFADDQPATVAFAERVAADMAGLDALVVLPWGVLPLADDGVRSPNPWRQLHFQALLEGLARLRVDAARLYWLPNGVIGLDDRVGWVIGEIVNGRDR